ncbi:MAG: AraC family transcriptional regulator, partial [Rhizobacter sp.]
MAATLQRPVPARAARNWIYLFERGFLYACQGLSSESVRFSVSVLLSPTGQPFEVEVEGHRACAVGFVVQPGAWRRLRAADVPLVSIGLTAAHPWFRTISTLKMPHGLLPLSRADFAHCDDALEAARLGALSPPAARSLSDAVMQVIAARLPAPRPLDARIKRVISMVREDFRVPLDTLATEVHLSYHRLSHLFSESMGLALRNYVLARKLDVAFALASRGMTMTQIAAAAGFADAAHFSRIWMRAGGAPPSYFLNNDDIQ